MGVTQGLKKIGSLLSKAFNAFADAMEKSVGNVQWPEEEVLKSMEKQGWRFEMQPTMIMALSAGCLVKWVVTPEGVTLAGPNSTEADLVRYQNVIANTRKELQKNKPTLDV